MEKQTDQNPAPVATNLQPINSSHSSSPKYLTLILVALVAALLASAGTYLALKQSTPPPQIISQTPSPSPTPDPTANLQTYKNKNNTYSFQYSQNYKLVDENSETASFGLSIYGDKQTPYLTISSKDLTDINSFKFCSELPSELPKDNTSIPCIAEGSGWGQKNDIEDVFLGGRKAKSFYLGGGVDYAYHIVQTVDNPRLELKMNVAGGGLDRDFKQILSTFKFTP